jgi:hypothetical protein
VILLATVVASAVAVALYGPIAQPPGYHAFADGRYVWGVSNFWNVVSSIPLLIVGLAGAAELVRHKPQGLLVSLRTAYLLFFVGAVLVAIGSAYYHFAPTDQSLVWDRLPMTIAFMTFFAIIIGEHISPRLGRLLLYPLLALGLFSVVYWYFTEEAGHGDLRLYIIVQYLPMILIPFILLFLASRLSHVWMIWAVLGAYGLAKLLEVADAPVFSLSHAVSGHTLKHLAAALGVYVFLLAIRRRHPLGSGTNAPEGAVARGP